MKPVMLATDGSPSAEPASETAIELAQLLETDLIIVSEDEAKRACSEAVIHVPSGPHPPGTNPCRSELGYARCSPSKRPKRGSCLPDRYRSN